MRFHKSSNTSLKLTVTGTQQRPNCSMLLAAHFRWRAHVAHMPITPQPARFPTTTTTTSTQLPPSTPIGGRAPRQNSRLQIAFNSCCGSLSLSRSDASLDWKSKRRRFPKEPSQDAAKPNRSPNQRLPHRQSPLRNISARGVIDAFNHHRPSTLFTSVWS